MQLLFFIIVLPWSGEACGRTAEGQILPFHHGQRRGLVRVDRSRESNLCTNKIHVFIYANICLVNRVGMIPKRTLCSNSTRTAQHCQVQCTRYTVQLKLYSVHSGADTGFHSGGCEILKREKNFKKGKFSISFQKVIKSDKICTHTHTHLTNSRTFYRRTTIFSFNKTSFRFI